MKIEIRNRWTNEIIYECEAKSLRVAVEECARLGKSLFGANLDGANLDGANLDGARLDCSSLVGSSLVGANLDGSTLVGANLDGSSLVGARLVGSNLFGASLDGARLDGARLDGSRLDGANLDGSIGADLAISQTRILPEGSIYGYKKVRTPTGAGIVKLLIPEHAARSHAFGRKCRCEYAEVVEAPDGAYTDTHGPRTEYRVGEVVKPDKWDEDWTNECSNGIHFFITRLEAENY